jgi:thioesterase domain-containing protein
VELEGDDLLRLQTLSTWRLFGKCGPFPSDRTRAGIPKSAFLGWEKVVSGGISIVDVPGKHSTVLSEPGVRVVAKNLDVLLADAKEAVRPGSKPEETSS